MTVVALRRPPPDTRQLLRCLLLAVLLHVWLVLMFGNTAGTAAPGQGVWGSLSVKLLGRSGAQSDAPPGAAGGTGAPTRPRPSTPAAPGAAEVGRWNPQEVPPEVARSEELSTAPPSPATLELPEGFRPVERQDLSPAPRSAPLQVPTPELPSATLGRLEAPPDTPVTPLRPAANLRTPSRPVELPPLASDLPAPVNRLEAANTTPATATLPRPADLRMLPAPAATALTPGAALPAPVGRLEAPAAVSAGTPLPRPTDLRMLPAPAATALTPGAALPAPVGRLEAPTAVSAGTPLPRPTDLRMLPAPAATALTPGAALPAPVGRLEAPAAVSAGTPLPRPAELRSTTAASPLLAPATPLPSPVQRLEAQTAESGALTPLARSNDLRTATPAANASALQGAQDLPAPVRRLESTEVGGAVAPLQPAPSARAIVAAPGGASLSELSGNLPGQVNAPTGPARGDPTANPYAGPKASAGSPDAGSRLGPDLPTPPLPPTAAASTPTRAPLNLSLTAR